MVAPGVDAELVQSGLVSPLRRIWILLSVGRVKDACTAAIAMDDLRLATLLAQVGGMNMTINRFNLLFGKGTHNAIQKSLSLMSFMCVQVS